MPQPKRKISVTIDEDLVEALGEFDGTLSAQVNDAIRLVVEQRRRTQALGSLLADLEALEGPVDEHEVRRFMDMLA